MRGLLQLVAGCLLMMAVINTANCACEEGYKEKCGQCLKLFNESMTIGEAAENCRNENATLPAPHTVICLMMEHLGHFSMPDMPQVMPVPFEPPFHHVPKPLQMLMHFVDHLHHGGDMPTSHEVLMPLVQHLQQLHDHFHHDSDEHDDDDDDDDDDEHMPFAEIFQHCMEGSNSTESRFPDCITIPFYVCEKEL